MRGIDELDHYELLEISRGATGAEIHRAYRIAQQTYADGSLALYSVFEDLDAQAIRERLDNAYRVLSDPELRALYDEAMKQEAPIAAVAVEEEEGGVQGPLFQNNFHSEVSEHAAMNQAAADAFPRDSFDDAVEEFDALEDDGRGEFDGTRLRRNRLFRGYEIDDISEVTKVNGNHLRNIEADNFVDLPADVYVRGFVTAYAQTIGLDPKVVVPSYMARVKESRSNNQRGRFLARR